MSWDDEDFTVASDDEALLDSWDAPEEPVVKKPAAAAKKPAKKAAAAGKTKTLMAIDLVDEKTKREMLKQAEMDADLNNAADLFDGLGLNEHPRSRQANAGGAAAALTLSVDTPLTAHPLFCPESKADYEKLRKRLADVMRELSAKSSLFYANALAVDMVRDLCDPLSIEQTRKAISTLNSLVNQKVKDERANRMKKTGGTSTGGAGKKKAKAGNVNTGPANFTKDNLDDFMGGDDDFGDDDFM